MLDEEEEKPKYKRNRPAWHGWYKKQRWRNRSALQLKQHPLCAMCLQTGVVREANVADHVVSHKGNHYEFWYGKLQSLCFDHHNGAKQQLDHKGFVDDIGVDGWPVDQNHLVYKSFRSTHARKG